MRRPPRYLRWAPPSLRTIWWVETDDLGSQILAAREKERALPPYGPLWKSDAHICERTEEPAIVGFPRIDAAIHRAEKEIRAITCADFEVLNAIRHPSEPAHIGNDDGATASVIRRGRVLVDRHMVPLGIFWTVIATCRLMMRDRFLTTKQQGRIDPPIERKLACLQIAIERL